MRPCLSQQTLGVTLKASADKGPSGSASRVNDLLPDSSYTCGQSLLHAGMHVIETDGNRRSIQRCGQVGHDGIQQRFHSLQGHRVSEVEG